MSALDSRTPPGRPPTIRRPDTGPTPLDSKAAGRYAAVAGAVLAVGAVVPLVISQLHRDWRYNFLDLQIYRSAVLAARHAPDVYALTLSWAHLPFTYPPFALVVLAWLGFVPLRAAGIVAMTGSLALLAGTCWVIAQVGLPSLLRRVTPAVTAAAAAGLFALAVEFEPVRSTIGFGQLNLVLMALVVLDATIVPARWQGTLSGLATAVKLTPGVFLPYHWYTGGWRAAARQAGTAAAVTVATSAVLPRESRRYWTSLLFTNRAGPTTFASNQSWTGVVNRLTGTGPAATTAVVILDLLTVVVVIAAVRATVGRGQRLSALAAAALAALLISPISWSHHWVWAVVVVAALLLERPFPGASPTAVLLGLLFYLGPQWRVPFGNGVEQQWTWWQTIVGNAYTLAGAAILAVLALSARHTPGPGVSRQGVRRLLARDAGNPYRD